MMYDFAAKPMSKDDIYKAAYLLRTFLGIERDLYFPVVHSLDLLWQKLGLEYEIVPEEEMGDLHGQTIPGMNLIRIREDVYIGAEHGQGRDRFTIAHEIGHWLLHDLPNIGLARVAPGSDMPAYMKPEWQANEFGAALLMPPQLISNLNLEQVMRLCGVSKMAAEVQMRKLKK